MSHPFGSISLMNTLAATLTSSSARKLVCRLTGGASLLAWIVLIVWVDAVAPINGRRGWLLFACWLAVTAAGMIAGWALAARRRQSEPLTSSPARTDIPSVMVVRAGRRHRQSALRQYPIARR